MQACNDSKRVDRFVFASEQHAMVMARLENLGKHAIGAAVQSLSLHLGGAEGLALSA